MIGKVFSGYKILALAGSGGMGQVYRAIDERLSREVALKVLHPSGQSDPQRRRRLLLEARAYSILKHPGVVSIYAVGEDHGMDFIAMEWIHGQTLADRLANAEASVADAVDIAVQVAEALSAVHAAGLVHRDVKPQNVMVADDGTVTLLDFGIAKLRQGVDATTLDEAELTREGMAPGTMAYMAPEQALGEDVDQRADLFACGVLLYEMLAGQRPFQGATVAGVARQLLLADPQPLHEVRGDVPQALQAIVLKALAKKPEDRYSNAGVLAADLRELSQQTSQAAFQDRESGTAPLVSRSPWRGLAQRYVLVAALAAVGVLVGAGLERVGSREASSTLPKTPFEIYQEGMSKLVRYDRAGYIDDAIVLFESAVTNTPKYAPAHIGLATAYWRQYRAKRDLGWLDKATRSVEQAMILDPLLSEGQVLLARIKTSQGLLDEARADLLNLRQLQPQDAGVLTGLAEIAQLERKPAVAVELFSEAVALDPQNWELRTQLGNVQLQSGKLDAAADSFRASLGMVADNAIAHRSLGAILHYQGRYGEAVTELQRSITIQPSSIAYSNLGTAYFFQGSYREAAVAYEEARKLGANDYILWSNLGDAYRQLAGKEKDALVCFQRASQILEPKVAAAPEDATLRSRMALFLVKAGKPLEALREIQYVEPLQAAAATRSVAYRATLVYELAGERASALRALTVALESGYPTVEILQDPELIRLREDVAFHELIVRFR